MKIRPLCRRQPALSRRRRQHVDLLAACTASLEHQQLAKRTVCSVHLHAPRSGALMVWCNGAREGPGGLSCLTEAEIRCTATRPNDRLMRGSKHKWARSEKNSRFVSQIRVTVHTARPSVRVRAADRQFYMERDPDIGNPTLSDGSANPAFRGFSTAAADRHRHDDEEAEVRKAATPTHARSRPTHAPRSGSCARTVRAAARARRPPGLARRPARHLPEPIRPAGHALGSSPTPHVCRPHSAHPVCRVRSARSTRPTRR